MPQRVRTTPKFRKARSSVRATHGPAHDLCGQRAIYRCHVPDEDRPTCALWPLVAQILDGGATRLDGQWQYVRTPTFGADNLQGALAPVKILQLETSDLSNS